MNKNLLNVIKKIVEENGEAVLSDSRRVSAFLADLARDVPKPQKNALVKGLEHGFAQTLKDVSEQDRGLCKQRLAQRLYDEEGLDLGLCSETLELLAAVLFGEEQKKTLCKNCGKELQEEWKVCPFCGAAVGSPIINSAISSGSGIAGYGIGLIKPTVNITQDEPESILLKAIVTAEQEYPSYYAMNNGNLIITNKRVVFTSSRLLNVDVFGSADSDLSFYYDEIAEVRNTKYNLVFPAIEITTNDGYKIKFGGYGKIKIAYEIICDKIKA